MSYFYSLVWVFLYSDRKITKPIHIYIKGTFQVQMNPKRLFVCLNGWVEFQSKILAHLAKMIFLKL